MVAIMSAHHWDTPTDKSQEMQVCHINTIYIKNVVSFYQQQGVLCQIFCYLMLIALFQCGVCFPDGVVFVCMTLCTVLAMFYGQTTHAD